MKFKFLGLCLFTLCSPLCFRAQCQDFEGRLSYQNYQVIGKDTLEASSFNYWIKDHLYKHSGYVSSMPLMDLGTLYADAVKMEKVNIDKKGKVDRVPIEVSWDAPKLSAIETNDTLEILGFNCKQLNLIDTKTKTMVSKIWVTDQISNKHFDQFVELFDAKNTLFPIKGINGWILKREDYRREEKIFVTELKEMERIKLTIAEMAVY